MTTNPTNTHLCSQWCTPPHPTTACHKERVYTNFRPRKHACHWSYCCQCFICCSCHLLDTHCQDTRASLQLLACQVGVGCQHTSPGCCNTRSHHGMRLGLGWIFVVVYRQQDALQPHHHHHHYHHNDHHYHNLTGWCGVGKCSRVVVQLAGIPQCHGIQPHLWFSCSVV